MPFGGAYSLTVEAAPKATFGRQEHIYVVCLHCLPPSYSREPLKNSTPLYIILVISLYSKIMKKGKSEHIHFLIIRNALNFTPVNFLHHFIIYIYIYIYIYTIPRRCMCFTIMSLMWSYLTHPH